MRISIVILVGALLTQEALAAEDLPATLDQLFERVNELPNARGVPGIFESLKARNQDVFKRLCEEIKAEDFYDKAQKAGVGTIKNRAMVSACSGVEFERATLKKTVQKEKPIEVEKKAVIQLRPIDFTKTTRSVEEEQKALKAVEAQILENAEKLGKTREVEEKLEKTKENLVKAQEFYDNLSAVIMVMRDDLKAISFKVFRPRDHESDTPEQYLEALEASLPNESHNLLSTQDKEQLGMASKLLKEANENHALARIEMEAINREMMEMAK